MCELKSPNRLWWLRRKRASWRRQIKSSDWHLDGEMNGLTIWRIKTTFMDPWRTYGRRVQFTDVWTASWSETDWLMLTPYHQAGSIAQPSLTTKQERKESTHHLTVCFASSHHANRKGENHSLPCSAWDQSEATNRSQGLWTTLEWVERNNSQQLHQNDMH